MTQIAGQVFNVGLTTAPQQAHFNQMTTAALIQLKNYVMAGTVAA